MPVGAISDVRSPIVARSTPWMLGLTGRRQHSEDLPVAVGDRDLPADAASGAFEQVSGPVDQA